MADDQDDGHPRGLLLVPEAPVSCPARKLPKGDLEVANTGPKVATMGPENCRNRTRNFPNPENGDPEDEAGKMEARTTHPEPETRNLPTRFSNYRPHTLIIGPNGRYLRLDGAASIADRRDMVNDFQQDDSGALPLPSETGTT